MSHNHGGFPWRAHRCKYCQKLAVTYPHGNALCAVHASDPDSEVYILKLEEAKKKYLNIYGMAQWDEFCSRTFQANGKNYEDFTWKEIAEAAEKILRFAADIAQAHDRKEQQKEETQLRNGG